MTGSNQLSRKTKQMAEAIDSGKADPLQFSLLEPYRQLKYLNDVLPARLVIDEILNNILSAKVHRVQELARILSAPDVYVKMFQRLTTRQIGRMMRYRRPFVIPKLNYKELAEALERILRGIKPKGETYTDDPIIDEIETQGAFVLQAEEAITLKRIYEFADTFPANEPVSVQTVLRSDNIDIILERFLMIIILISKGVLLYSPKDQMLVRVNTSGEGDQ